MDMLAMMLLVAAEAAGDVSTGEYIAGGGIGSVLLIQLTQFIKGLKKQVPDELKPILEAVIKEAVPVIVKQLQESGVLPETKHQTRESVEAEIAAEQQRDERLAKLVAEHTGREIQALWHQETEAKTQSDAKLISALDMLNTTAQSQVKALADLTSPPSSTKPE